MRVSPIIVPLAVSLALSACTTNDRSDQPLSNWGGQHFSVWTDTAPEYRFFPGDSLDITVHTAPELSRITPIGPDGRISLPLLTNIMVAGQTDHEIANVVADAYAVSTLVSPIVEVRRAQLGPQNIIVGGEVTSAGLISMPGPIGAMEAVMLAGGFRDTAAIGKVVILRRAAGGGIMMRTVDLKDTLRGIPSGDNLQLRRHDIVFVPRSTIAEITLFIEQYITGIVPLDQAFSYAIANSISSN
jgi:protein involved in polysaccharide export with SLBB domain